MRRVWFAVVGSFAMSALASAVVADQAHVTAGVEVGQAVLFNDGGTCFALTPQHVIDAGNGFGSLFLREGVLLDGWAQRTLDLGHDLSLLTVDGAVTQACGMALAPHGEAMAAVQAAGGRMKMRVILANGETLFRDVELAFQSSDRITFREVQDARQPPWSVQPGDSGSLLMFGDVPVGIVQTQGSADSLPTALPWPYAVYLADWRRKGAVDKSAPPAPPPAAAGNARVERSTARPLAPDLVADNLTLPREAGGEWYAMPVEWPVEIVLALQGEGVGRVSAVTFLRSKGAPEAHPREVEVFLSRDAEGERSWQSFGNAVLSKEIEAQTIDLGLPRRARRVRLLIHSGWAADGSISLGRIEISGE
ncbi:MAG: hypothetical protein R3D90_12595 [Paracoccaceae bacterium]